MSAAQYQKYLKEISLSVTSESSNNDSGCWFYRIHIWPRNYPNQ